MTTKIHYPLAFTTLACPAWSWEQIVQRAVEYGYQGIELRGVEGEMDLPKAAPFVGSRLASTKRDLQERGLAIACLDTSCRFDQVAEMDKNIDEGRRAIDLANALEAPYIRVFGDRIANAESRETIIEQVTTGVLTLARHAEGSPVQVLLESHGDFAQIQNILDVLQAVQHPSAAILWDVHHPYRFFAEPLAQTYERLKPYIRHVHLKDSVPTSEGVHYCLMGQGTVPTGEVLQLLHDGGYNGWLSFEWEKRWHPEIEEPEVALPDFVRVIRSAEATRASGQ